MGMVRFTSHTDRHPPQEWKLRGSISACGAGIFPDQVIQKIGPSVATLPGTWHYRSVLGLVGLV